MKDLGRLITAMVTPFKEDGSVDYEQAKGWRCTARSGSDGCGSGNPGESPTLLRDEELRLFARSNRPSG
jgi:4-hydroxy-tetrahydrodipicolinate synthase